MADCRLRAGLAMYRTESQVEGPSELLPPGVSSASYRPGLILSNIRENWLDGKVHTLLTAEQMAAIEQLAWHGAWIDGLRRKRAERGARDW